MQKFRFSIRVKILTTLAVLLLASLSVMALSTLKSARSSSEQSGKALSKAATQVADRISRTIYERYGDVQAFTLNRVAQDKANWGKFGEDNPLVATMNEYAAGYGIYSITMLVGLDGKVVAINTRDPSRKTINTTTLCEKSYSDAAWFKDAVEAGSLRARARR